MCRESRAADGERYDSLVEDTDYLPKPARPFSAAMVPRGGLAQSKQINDLSVRGTPESPYTIIRLSAASVQRQDGADPTILNGISPPFRLRKSSIPLSGIEPRPAQSKHWQPSYLDRPFGKAVDIATDDFTHCHGSALP
jgi:hypothetical protein